MIRQKSEDLAHEVANWLRSLTERVKDVRPCRVGIGKSTYGGARYTGIFHYTQSMMAVIEGQAKGGELYYSDTFYLLGKLPTSYKKKAVYVIENQEWYVSGYSSHVERNEYQPFGWDFMLCVWNIPDGTKIDHYEERKRQRLPVEVTYLDR